MRFVPIKTRALVPPKDNLYALLDQHLPRLKERDVLVITSKILAIHQGQCVKIRKGLKKDELVKREAEAWLPRDLVPQRLAMLTIKNHTLIPSAGIDSKNGRGHYILWPKNPTQAARQIWKYLRKKYRLKQLGIIITDSHSIPLRLGTVGISIGFYGFKPLREFSRTKSIFGARLKIARSNIPDALAAAASLRMGEGADLIPLVIVRGASFIKFTNRSTWAQLTNKIQNDLYAPLLKIFDSR